MITPNRHTDVLVAVDVQNDFCPGGALAVGDGDAVVPAINRLARHFDHLVATQDWHPADHRSFASQHSGQKPLATIDAPMAAKRFGPIIACKVRPGAALHSGLDVTRAELILRKGYRSAIDSYSAFVENDRRTPTGLGGYLRERELTRVFFAGLATDYCVAFSAIDAAARGFTAYVVLDACRAIDLDGSLAAALQEIGRAGVTVVNERDIQ